MTQSQPNAQTYKVMMTEAFSSDTDFFDRNLLSRRDTVPAHLVAPGVEDDQKAFRQYAPGFGVAMGLILSNQVTIEVGTQGGLRVRYSFNNSDYEHCSEADPKMQDGGRRWYKPGLEQPQAAAMLNMCEALVFPGLRPLTLSALSKFAVFASYPVDAAALAVLPREQREAKDFILQTCDYAYQDMYDAIGAGEETIKLVDKMETAQDYVPLSTRHIAAALGIISAGGNDSGSNQARLRRAFRRGWNVLLVGPPATLKTSSINALAVEQSCWMVPMRGTPSVEDRDFIGAITPTEHGPRWVDGPLARAFTLGKRAPGIIKIDEVLRYQPETMNSLITAMDELSYEDARRILEPPLRRKGLKLLEEDELAATAHDSAAQDKLLEQVIESIITDNLPEVTRYYMLELPNGDILFAPVKNVSFMMTTNWGEDHMQVADRMDGAIRSRIHMVLEYLRPDPETAQMIYTQAAQGNDLLTAIGAALDDAMFMELGDQDCLFERSTDLRKITAFLEGASDCLADGMSMGSAVRESARVTLASHVCPRDGRGTLEQAAEARFFQIVDDVLKEQGVS